MIWFDHELKEETKLFKDESPEEPDNENITADKKSSKTHHGNYKF